MEKSFTCAWVSCEARERAEPLRWWKEPQRNDAVTENSDHLWVRTGVREPKGGEEKGGGRDRDSRKAGDKDRKSLRTQGDRWKVGTGKTDRARSQRKIPGDR